MTPEQAHIEAMRRITACAESGDEILDLGDLPMAELPEELGRLTHLKVLALGNWKPKPTEMGVLWEWDGVRRYQQITDATVLSGLTNLTSLNLSWCSQLRSVRGLTVLTNLTELNLRLCSQLQNVDGLSGLTNLTSLSLRLCEKLQNVQGLSGLNNLTSLDLSWCSQLQDLQGLSGLTNLTSLDLRLCEQLQNLEGLSGLTNLTSLNLSRCSQLQNLDGLLGVSNLTSLDLSWCSQLQDVKGLAGVTDLVSLDLRGCEQLQSLEGLSGLTNLTSLELRLCSQLQNVDGLSGLTNLVSIGLSECEKLQDLKGLSGLTNLTSLDLRLCEQLQNLEGLSGLTNLTSLNLSRCSQLQNLDGLLGVSNLTSLNLSECKQLQNVNVLSGLTNLTSLNLRGCEQLQNLEGLSGLNNLTSLDLSNCGRLTFDPLRHLVTGKLSELRLYGTSWTDLDPVHCGKSHLDDCLIAVRAHFQDLKAGQDVDNEVKLLLLGNGTVGKTQLGLRLRNQPYNPDECSTHGIQLDSIEISPPGLEHSWRVNIWDFGGQEIYHGSHALFVKGRAVFLLLWTPETEKGTVTDGHLTLTNHPLAYWFDYLREMVGKRQSDGTVVVEQPVIVIRSRCDGLDQECMPYYLPDRKVFPRLYTLSYGAKFNHNLPILLGTIQEAIKQLHLTHKPYPLGAGRVNVRDALRQMQHDHIPRTMSVRQFITLCKKTKKVTNPDALLQFLHHTGVVYYQQDLFGNQIIVDQQWALDAVYSVLTREGQLHDGIRRRGGRFTRDDLDRYVWKGKYSLKEQNLFLSMMIQCHLCFRVKTEYSRNSEQEYVAPEFLDPWNKAHEVRYGLHLQTPPTETVTAEYRFLHEGIIRNLLSRIGHESGDNADFWKFGCNFYRTEDRMSDAHSLLPRP